MRSIIFVLIIFLSSKLLAYDFTDPRNAPTINSLEDKKWSYINNKNFIPFLSFKTFFENKNEPSLSIYIDRGEEIYKELYTYQGEEVILEVQLNLFNKGLNLSAEDKKLSFKKGIESIVSLNKNKIQEVSKFNKKEIGFNNFKKKIEHFHEGKFIEDQEAVNSDKYCTIFYFWSELVSSDTYKINIKTLICNLKAKTGADPFIPFKTIENFTKEINFYNTKKFNKLYEDEKTRLLKIKQEKEKKEARIKAEKEEQQEEEEALQKRIDEINENIKSTKSSISNALSIVIGENKILTSINKNFDKTKKIKKVNNQGDTFLKILNSQDNEIKNINKSIKEIETTNSNLENNLSLLKDELSNLNVAIKVYQKEIKIYNNNVKKREKYLLAKKNEEEEEKKLEQQKKDKAEKLKKETIDNLSILRDSKKTLLSELNSINLFIVKKIDLIQKENFVEEILLNQERERSDIEERYSDILKEDEKISTDITKLRSQYNYNELDEIIDDINNINDEISIVKLDLEEKNTILTNLIIQGIENQKLLRNNNNLTYILLGTIIILIIILILVFVFFIRSNRSRNTVQQANVPVTPVTEKSEVPKKEIKPVEKKQETKLKKEEIKSVQENDESKPIPEPIKKETKINNQEEEGIQNPILNQIKTEYVEAFKNPKLLQTFTLKWKVEAIDRISPLSSNEDVVLEQSKKIIDRSNFWAIRDQDNDLLIYILPGKVLWTRINEILSDNSRFGYMNFNGIYDLKEAKINDVVEVAEGQKDESGKITILNKGALNIIRII